jgi:hypothetical protein
MVIHIERGYKLRVFESRVQRKIPGPTRDEVRGERKQLHNDEFNDVHSYYSVYHDKTNEVGGRI